MLCQTFYSTLQAKVTDIDFLTKDASELILSSKERNGTVANFTVYFNITKSNGTVVSEIKEYFQLPSISTLRKITSFAKNVQDEQLLSSYLSQQDERCRGCIIILDGTASLTYQGGVVFGYSVDQPDKFATTLLCIMVKCFFTGKKFLVKLLPCHALNANFLINSVQDVLASLGRSGARVTDIVNDNNRVNQAFSKCFPLSRPSLPGLSVHRPTQNSHYFCFLIPSTYLKT
ncbi:group XV phospholipase a2 [Plakobranchus ocellatus]|uniref:Group XV phospholipase a2 n=1 Tax=Plakobranchus ocellatus TaxID=259542 RepID=A0AAV4BSH0_9GAST|nr:group XV phospholipase a2 [Plakobranchus ocellatus]